MHNSEWDTEKKGDPQLVLMNLSDTPSVINDRIRLPLPIGQHFRGSFEAHGIKKNTSECYKVRESAHRRTSDTVYFSGLYSKSIALDLEG